MPQEDIFINFKMEESSLLSARNMLLLEWCYSLFVLQLLYNVQYKGNSVNHKETELVLYI